VIGPSAAETIYQALIEAEPAAVIGAEPTTAPTLGLRSAPATDL
jgi:hypothetical protein